MAREVARGVRLLLVIQPRAARTEVGGPLGDALRIRVAAPPVDGAANEALVRFLAARLGVPRGAIRVTAGLSGRRKTVTVSGIGVATAVAALGGGADSGTQSWCETTPPLPASGKQT